MAVTRHYVVNIPLPTRSLQEEAEELCFHWGASGIVEDLDFRQELGNYQPVVVEKVTASLKVYFLSAPPEELLQELKELGLSPFVSEEQDKDWLQEWKRGFTSFPMTENFWIVPRWEDGRPEGKIAFSIEPGMAFGTGTHETTRLVVRAMETLSLSLLDVKSLSFLDVGTGTGILAFYALKQGYGRVEAIDNDPEALRVASENLAFNQAHSILVSGTPVEDLGRSFDVVVANIIQSVLEKIKGGLFKIVKPGGYLILSGVLLEHESDFRDSFLEASPFQVIDRSLDGDWVSWVLKRTS